MMKVTLICSIALWLSIVTFLSLYLLVSSVAIATFDIDN